MMDEVTAAGGAAEGELKRPLRPYRADPSPQPIPIHSIEDMPDLALVPEVAEFFRITISVCRDWIRAGKFPGVSKVGKEYRIPKQDVIALAGQMYGKR